MLAFGYLTTTITVADADRGCVEEKVRAVERIVNGLGFTCIRESINAVEAWLSSLPSHVCANVRQPIVHTLNLAHLMPLRSEEHTSELQSLMRSSYAVFCLKNTNNSKKPVT